MNPISRNLISLTLSVLLILSTNSSASELSDEMTIDIFASLQINDLVHKASEVCKKWNSVSQDQYLWTGKEVVYSGKGALPAYVTVVCFKDGKNCLSAIALYQNLVEITLDKAIQNSTPDTTYTEIGCLLQKNTVLKKLNIINCNFILTCPDYKLSDLVEIVATHEAITDLNFSSNIASDDEGNLDVAGVTILRYLSAFSQTTVIKKLSLSNNNLTKYFPLKMTRICPLILSLEELDLSNNKIGDDFEKMASLFISNSNKLKKLNISNNGISESNRELIKTQISSRLEKLDL